MNIRTLGAAAMTLAALAISPPLAAADESAASIHDGVERYVREDYEGARAAFARAYDLAPTPRTLFNLALAELQSGHALDSVRHMRAYLVELDVEPEKVAALKTKWLPRAESQTSRLQVEAATGAEIAVDGRSQGISPLEAIDVAIGEHDVEARSGKTSRTEHVSARAGERVVVRFDLAQALSSPAGRAPAASPRAAGSRGWTPAKAVTLVVLGSSAAVATALGVAFAIVSTDESNAARALLAELPPDPAHAQCTGDRLPAQCLELQADNRVAKSAYPLSTGFYIGGGVLACATVLLAVLWPSAPSTGPRPVETAPSTARLVPIMDGQRWGVGLQGAW